MTIRLRVTILCASVLSACLLLFGLCLFFFLHAYIFQDLEKSLKAQTNQIKQNVQYVIKVNSRGWDFSIQLDRFDTVRTGMYLQLYNIVSGERIKSNNLGNADLPVELDTLKESNQGYYKTAELGNVPFLIYNDPIIDGKVVGVLQSAFNISLITKFFSILRIVLVALSLIVIIIASYLGWLLSRNALKPVSSLINATAQIHKSDDLKTRININRSDEIGVLSKSINSMLERIQSMYEELNKLYTAQRRFVADASHELRTPLTTINGNAEFLKKIWNLYLDEPKKLADSESIHLSMEAINDIADEGNRMARLVNDLLVLARSDVGIQIQKNVLEIEPIIAGVIRKIQINKKPIQLRIGNLQVIENIQVLGNGDYLQQMIYIFLDNAFKYTFDGYVQVDASLTADTVSINISDTGIGMDDSEIPHIFERFYRADWSRGQTPGTGLGLSIAKWIIDEHRGTIDVISTKGKGTIFIIQLPIYYSSN